MSERSTIFGDGQKPSGHRYKQLALDGPAWAQGVDQKTSRGPFQSQPFCDSMKKKQNTEMNNNKKKKKTLKF